jgi:hypothetical protein
MHLKILSCLCLFLALEFDVVGYFSSPGDEVPFSEMNSFYMFIMLKSNFIELLFIFLLLMAMIDSRNMKKL